MRYENVIRIHHSYVRLIIQIPIKLLFLHCYIVCKIYFKERQQNHFCENFWIQAFLTLDNAEEFKFCDDDDDENIEIF